ncbi:MAG: malto-oligosyltrehalose trehalohydrolase [Proteobacteria bacterium]|nr:malto-oligosyltrehalose trehalohydrolase [Pseudomonadota bacterium]
MRRRHPMPFGAEVCADGGVRFRLWAPEARALDLLIEGPGPARALAMRPDPGGWFTLAVAEAGPGTRYRFRPDGGLAVPDPASRFQPDDVHGASEVIDPAAFDWSDGAWRGRPWEEAVFYELHVGTFTPEGTYEGTARRLDHLADLGVTAIELMPLADWPGARNWGYDGAYPFAPDARYGRPEALKALVAAAHARGLMVFLDVVYNHLGPEGNYLSLYAPEFFTERHHTPWGAAINFDGPGARTVRDFYVDNALYWTEEYSLDGLRFDAVHAICDDSRPHILEEVAEAVRARSPRPIHLVLENDRNDAHYLEREPDGRPRRFVAQWNEDLHHALHVLLTGEAEGYYADYCEVPARHLARSLAEGFSYQGERSLHRAGAPRGSPSAHLPPAAFVAFLQNHDQVGNRAFGERITALAEPEAVRAALALVLLSPAPPLLFMGEEWGARQPFPFFCDVEPSLAETVREGRRREFARFAAFREPAMRTRIPDPLAPETAARAVLDWADPGLSPHRDWLAFYRRLIAIRRREVVPRLAGRGGGEAGFRLTGARGLSVHWRLGDGARLSLVANMGSEPLSPAPPVPPGRTLYASADRLPAALAGGAGLPPWGVVWTLAETG